VSAARERTENEGKEEAGESKRKGKASHRGRASAGSEKGNLHTRGE